MNLAHLLARSARTFPDRLAVFLGERLLLDYRALASRVACIAGHRRNELKLASGDRVVIFMRNRPEYLELLYGIWSAGRVAVQINAKLDPKKPARTIGNAPARVIHGLHRAGTSTWTSRAPIRACT